MQGGYLHKVSMEMSASGLIDRKAIWNLFSLMKEQFEACMFSHNIWWNNTKYPYMFDIDLYDAYILQN